VCSIKKIICLVLLLINIYILFNLYIYNKKTEIERNAFNNKINTLFYQNILLKESLLHSIQGICTLPEKMMVYNESNDCISLKSLKRKKRSLILRYSHLSCKPCVDAIIACVKQFAEQNNQIEILLFSSYRFEKDLRDFKRMNKIFTEVYNVKYLDIPIEKENIPYIFIMDKNMNVFDFFIPQKDMLELTEQYIVL